MQSFIRWLLNVGPRRKASSTTTYKLIRAFMDEVRFNDQGNEITLFKRRPPLATRVFNSDELALAGR